MDTKIEELDDVQDKHITTFPIASLKQGHDSDEILSFSYNVYRKFFEEESKILDWECENND